MNVVQKLILAIGASVFCYYCYEPPEAVLGYYSYTGYPIVGISMQLLVRYLVAITVATAVGVFIARTERQANQRISERDP